MPSDTNMANRNAALAFVQVTKVVAMFEALWYRSCQEERDLATRRLCSPLSKSLYAQSPL